MACSDPINRFLGALTQGARLVVVTALVWIFATEAIGATAIPLASGLSEVTAIAVDGNYVYWAEVNGSTASLRRVLNSGGPTENLTTFTAFRDPFGIYRGINRIAFTATKLYFGWGSYDGDRIEEATKTGTSRRVVVPNYTGGNFLGVINGYVYYLQGFCCITKVPIDGSAGPQTVLTGNWVRSAAYDSGAIYFVEYFSRNVYRFDVATNTRTPLITGNAVEGGVAIDANNVYYSDGSRIRVVSKLGGSVSTLYTGANVSVRVSDGGILYFTEGSDLKAIPVTGGAVTLTLAGASVVGMVQDPNALYWADTSAGNGAGVIYRLQKDLIQGALQSSPLPVSLPPTQSLLQPSPFCVVPSATPSPSGGVCFQRFAAIPLSTNACVPPESTDNLSNQCAVPSRDVTTPNGSLTLLQPAFNVNNPTVVISHGWNPSSDLATPSWQMRMGQAVGKNANVFLWNWMEKAKTFANVGCSISDLDILVIFGCGAVPYGNVKPSGEALGAALDTAICRWDPTGCLSGTSTYTKPIHFIGHSLGTGVITYAAQYLQKTKFKNNVDQLTLLDSAYLTTPPGDTALPDLKSRSVNPVFIDKYNSLVGLVSLWGVPQMVNTNIYLPSFIGATGIDCRTGSPTFGLFDIYAAGAHAYGNWWYTSSYETFTCPKLLLDTDFSWNIPSAPPSNGVYWAPERASERGGNRSDVAFIYTSILPFSKWYLVPFSQLPKLAAGAVTYATGQVVDLTQKTLDAIQTTVVKTVTKVVVVSTKAFNTAQAAGEWAVDKAENAFWVLKNPGTAAVNGVIRLTLNSSATVHAPVFIPPTATSMRFSFGFIEASPGTALEVFLNDKLVYITRGDDLPGKGQQISDWLEIAPFAGKQVTMAFRLSNPVEGNRGTVDLDDIVIANVIAAGGPFALAKAPTTARANSVITLDGTGSIDPEPGPQQLTFAWSQLQGSAVQMVNGQSARPSFVGTTPGAYSFSLVVNDGQAASVPSFVTIVVPRLGDIDLNGDVDLNDLAKINAALNTNASGPNDLRDLNGDGMITALDARKLVTLCTRARCATQ